MATWTGNGPNSRTFVSNIKTGERSWQVDLETHNHSEIREMQQKLSSFGFSTQGADGTYGNNTKNAVINFQRAFPTCGTPDGYFGKNTLNTFVSKVGSLAGYTGPGSGGVTDQINVGDTVITILPGVNFRSTPGGARLLQVSTGTTMVVTEITTSGGYTWYKGEISGKTGYLRGDCVEKYTGSSSGENENNYNIKLSVETDRYGTGTSLSLRAGKSTGAAELCKIPAGATIMVSTKSGEWLPTKYNNKTGYVMAKYVSGSDVYCANISGVTGITQYNRDAAVAYAQQYSSNASGTSSYNNAQYKPIGDSPNNINKDCANFVSQCLFAGGMPMHDGWYYRYPGNVANPSVNSAWKGTNSQKKSIASRKWGERVYSINKLKRGDLVYTYDTEQNDGTFGHVVIVTQDVGNSSKMIVCGHTVNQRDAERLPKAKDAYFHIYDTLPTKANDYLG